MESLIYIIIWSIMLKIIMVHGQHSTLHICDTTQQNDALVSDQCLLSFIDDKFEQMSFQFSSLLLQQDGAKHIRCPVLSNTQNLNCDNRLARDCSELRAMGYRSSGVYTIYPITLDNALNVYCDMETREEGWTVIQRRQDGSVNFTRDWQAYRDGFGDLNGEFWLGNKYIHALTSQRPYRLRVDTVDFEHNRKHALYAFFKVENEENNFRLFVDTYSGTAGDGFRSGGNGANFSTIDRDNDGYSADCALTYNAAGWWYASERYCGYSHLNNPYSLNSGYITTGKGLTWYSRNMPLRFTEMKLA